MSYRQRLTIGWARRDSLAVIVIAVTVAFLVGAAVLGIALGTQTTEIASEFDNAQTIVSAEKASSDAIRFIVGETDIQGESYTVVGFKSESAAVAVGDRTVSLPEVVPGKFASATDTPTSSVVTRRPHPLVPDDWLVTDFETARSMTDTRTLALDPGDNLDGAPIIGALQFLMLGSMELAGILRLTALAAAVLVMVTVYSVVRITIQERNQDIAVIRATGAPPWRIITVFSLRGILLTGIGVALGYAGGLIIIRSIINAATFLSVPTTLSAELTPQVASILLPAFMLFVTVGMIAGVIAAWRIVRIDPASINDRLSIQRGLTKHVQTTFIDWKTTIPALATLAVFMCFLFILIGVGGSVGPLAGAEAGQQTITEPGTPNPLASDVPATHADALRAQGITVSPEIILFEVVDGTPVLTRGVNFTAYQEFTQMSIQDGRLPRTSNEAIIGSDLAQSTEIGVGETILLGGSTTPAIARVRVTGKYTAGGIEDDQLLVSLPMARTLGGVRGDAVNIIRTQNLTASSNRSTIVVTDARADRQDGQPGIRLTVRNPGLQPDTRVLQVDIGEQRQTASVSVDAQKSNKIFIQTDIIEQSDRRVRVGGFEATVGPAVTGTDEIVNASSPSLSIPEVVPANSTLRVQLTRKDVAVANAQIKYRDITRQTDSEGEARLPFGRQGTENINIVTNKAQFERTISIQNGAKRPLDISVVIDPQQPSIFTQPTAEVNIKNPWGITREERIRVSELQRQQSQSVQVPPGESTVKTFSLAQRPAGSYTVEISTSGGQQVNTTYQVQGDERLGAALAQSGRYTTGGGIAQGIEIVFSNIEVLIATIVVLLLTMTLGSSTAAFTRSIQTTRRKIGIYRATGATPYTILLNVARDAALIGATASVGAFVISAALIEILLSTGALRMFGIVLRPQYSGLSLAIALIGGTGLAVISAVLAASAIVWNQPSQLFNNRVNMLENER